MILTTPTKQPYTTTKHNNKSYIFTLYIFMLLCVVGNCLLFYCSCTGNCENCCGINGLLRIANIDQDGKVDGNNILNKLFVNGENKASVNVSIYRGSTEKEYNDAKDEFLKNINQTCKTHLSAYVEVGDIARYFIHCTDANSIKDGYDNFYNGLFYGSEATKIVILSCGSEIKNMSALFRNCSSLTNLDLSKLKTDNVINMSYMFYNCSSLTNLDLSKFNTTNVIDMSYMFSWSSGLTNIKSHDNFTTNNVTNMSFMFYNCSKLTVLKLSSFNTENVTNMSCMFDNCSSLTKLDLSNFNTSNVTYMDWMFYNCSKLTVLNLSNFNTDKVTDMGYMFNKCSKLTELDLSSFNTNKVTNMKGMFNNCFQTSDISFLICKAITLKKITENKKSCLIIPNENEKNDEINDIIENNNNPEQVYKCSVERGEKDINPQITAVKEYPQQ